MIRTIKNKYGKVTRMLVGGVSLLLVTACANTGTSGDANDPYESFNRGSFKFNNTLDSYVVGPVAEGYDAAVPDYLQNSVGNFLDNLGYPRTVLNSFLQGDFEQGLEDSMRFIFNSTLGIGGLFDISTGLGLPAENEDFGQTLAVWGVPEGAYVELPIFGPKTMRELPALPIDIITGLDFWFASPYSEGMAAGKLVDTRVALDEVIELRDSQLDPYIFQREGYRQIRNNAIRDGKDPLPGEQSQPSFEDEFGEEDFDDDDIDDDDID